MTRAERMFQHVAPRIMLAQSTVRAYCEAAAIGADTLNAVLASHFGDMAHSLIADPESHCARIGREWVEKMDRIVAAARNQPQKGDQ